MCAHKPCTCGQTRPTSVAELDALDHFDALDDIDAFAGGDDVADWAESDVMEDALGFEDDADGYADEYTFGTDNRFQVRSQARPPSTRLFPFNTVCQIRPFGSRAGAFSGVLIAPRVVLTVKHGLFTNLATPSCVRFRSTRTTRSRGRFTVCPGLDQTQRPGRRTIARPMSQAVAPARQVAHPTLDLALMFLPVKFRVPNRYMLLQPRSTEQTRNRLVTLAGYPADMPFGTMWGHSDRVLRVEPTHLRYQIDLCPGQSGGPVWLRGSGETRVLLAIQSAQQPGGGPPGRINCGSRPPGRPLYNCGVRITCEAIQWILAECRRRRVQAPNVDQPTFRRCPRPGR